MCVARGCDTEFLNPSSVLPTGQGPSMNDPTSADQGLLNAAAKRKEISPREELSLMKKTTGGFKLALKLMTEDLYYHSHILLEVTRPLWSWYAAEIQSVKTPKDSVKRSAQLALGGWKKSAFAEDSSSASEFNISAVHI